MAEDSAQERTEKASPKRLQDAREKGQVPRSRELNTTTVLLVSASGLLVLGRYMINGLDNLFHHQLTIDRAAVFDDRALGAALYDTLTQALELMAPFFVLVTLAALLAPMAMGGISFAGEALKLDFTRLDPIKGIKRVFGPKGLMELAKALVKFAVIAALAVALLWHWSTDLMSLGMQSVNGALGYTASFIVWALLLISSGMVLIAAVDVPFQLWDHGRQLKMTRQEVKDEFKETDGQPEVKGRLRNLQREYAKRRMMAAIPDADVVVVNPQHYAVALRYDQNNMNAPVLVAKGTDYLALQIRSLAKSHSVPILSAPALARAIYHSTEIDREIPAGLYVAVAKVLAYIYQLRRKYRRDSDKPLTMEEELPIPDDLKRDE
ncbi:MAG TPA: flagellar biosynthesis protein FlhB [Gammaproteobacteria bacterium]|nr:flagellar biosynthesis protein FlhB [Gammaproteobacteria bacterium]